MVKVGWLGRWWGGRHLREGMPDSRNRTERTNGGRVKSEGVEVRVRYEYRKKDSERMQKWC